jgi:hypothetical protein
MRALLDRLQQDGDAVFGERQAQIVPVSFQARESSEVTCARVTTSRGVRHVFAKLFKPRPGEPGLAQARIRFATDYAVTRRVCDAMKQTQDLRAVEPIACYEDLLGVVTNQAPGVPLNDLLATDAAWPMARWRLARLEEALRRTGQWIAVFQRIATDGAPAALNVNSMREYLDVRLHKLVSLSALSDGDRRALCAYFDRTAAAVRSSDFVNVAVHGDVVPSNVIVAPECITVIDFGMTASGSKYLDIARLYTQLAFYAAKPYYRPGVIERLQQVALAGFDGKLKPDDPLFELCAVQHVVCHLLSHTRQPGRFPASIYSQHLCRRHRQWLQERTRTRRAHRVGAPDLAERMS